MNNAPSLSLSTRVCTALFALAAALATTHSLDALSVHYSQHGASQMACTTTAAKAHQA